VFISHAVKDRALVQEIVSLIEEGMGIPEEEIFCSSLNGYGIPNGKNFVTFIKEQLLDPKVAWGPDRTENSWIFLRDFRGL
jgi:hypothetical protein